MRKKQSRRSLHNPIFLMLPCKGIGGKICIAIILGFLGLFFIPLRENALALNLRGATAIGAAYTTHLFLHEVGHQVVADDVGASSHRMSFFTQKNGKFYPGLSTYESIPKKSILPYAIGGERMASYTFEYSLYSYKKKPATFNKALMFFSCADFFIYTLLATYGNPNDTSYDPNLIREKMGISKEIMLSLVAAKSLVNTYRMFNDDVRVAPMVWVDETSAALIFHFTF